MVFIPSRDLRIKPGEVWRSLKRNGEIIITSNGKPIALMTEIFENDLESTLNFLKRVRAEMAVAKIRKRAAKIGLDKLTDREIAGEIKKARIAR